MDDEIRLSGNAREREKYDILADLYAIFLATEALEKAYMRDAVTAEQYTPMCSKLIAQFRTARTAVSESVPSIDKFIADYDIDCPAAVNRLVRIGVPATVEHPSEAAADDGSKRGARYVAEVVQHFITLMDALKLNMAAVDQVHPLLADLMASLHKVPKLPPDFEGKAKVRDWLVTLNKLKASDELDENQARQLLFDLESAHTAFYRFLSDA